MTVYINQIGYEPLLALAQQYSTCVQVEDNYADGTMRVRLYGKKANIRAIAQEIEVTK